jgi:hypothetical protein
VKNIGKSYLIFLNKIFMNKIKHITQSEFTLSNFNPTFVDITCWYGVKKYKSDNQKLYRYTFDTSHENFEVAIIPQVIINHEGDVALTYVYKDHCPNCSSEFIDPIVQRNGKLIQDESDLNDFGFYDCDLLCLSLCSDVDRDDQMGSVNIVDSSGPFEMDHNTFAKVIYEITYSDFLRRNILPLEFLGESDIQTNFGYRILSTCLMMSCESKEIDRSNELLKHWIDPKHKTNKSRLGSTYKFGLEKIPLRELPSDDYNYLIPCKIYFNKTQSSLGFYKTPCEFDNIEDFIIYKNPGWISVLNDSESMKELGHKIIDEEFHYNLLIGIS